MLQQNQFGAHNNGSLNAQACPHFPISTKVTIAGLSGRKDLNGKRATVILDDTSGRDGRVAIMVEDSGEDIRIKAENCSALKG
eukprot:9530923-Karenia_brevis.AAC.1